METKLVHLLVRFFCTTAGMSLVIPFYRFILKSWEFTIQAPSADGLVLHLSYLLMAAIVSPLWGSLADKYGRKLMLLRASLGMAIVMTSIGFVQNVYQLVGLRF